MKKIAIVSLGYMWFPCEPGPSRFYQIAKTFVDAGYDVEVITTDFQHFKKAPRDKQKILSEGYPFQITFIQTPPYKKNIDVRRVLSNRTAEKDLRKYLEQHVDEYTAVYTSIPANNIAAATVEICHKHSVPCVVDVEDLWPEAMSMIIKNDGLRNFLLRGFLRDAETAYKYCSGVIGTSDDYTARAFKNQKRNIPNDTVYVGVNLKDFDEGVEKFKDEIEKPEGEFWVTYTGSISTSYDIKTLILAAKKLAYAGHPEIKVQILGTGSLKDELEEFSKDISNVKFWGFTMYPKMAAVLSKSDVTINSFVKGAPQSIVNKVGDYLASGKAMINTLENPVFCKLVVRGKCGINIEPENVDVLAKTILGLKTNEKQRLEMGRNARKLAEVEFDRTVSYKKIVKLTEQVM